MPKPEAPYPPVDPPEAVQRVNQAIQRLHERGALKDNRCPQCGTDDWNVDFIAIPAVFLPKGGLNIPRAGGRDDFGCRTLRF